MILTRIAPSRAQRATAFGHARPVQTVFFR